MGPALSKTKSYQKRSNERKPSSFHVKFQCSDLIYYGIVFNVSENGMCISTGMCLPSDEVIKLLIPIKDGNMEVAVRVKWTLKTYDFYDNMGVELIKPSRKYLQLFKRLTKQHSA